MAGIFRRAAKPDSVLLLERGHGSSLAWGVTPGGDAVIATLDALVVGGSPPTALPWHLIDKAAWEPPVFTIRFREGGAAAGAMRLELAEAGKLPPVVRERVTRSVVISQRVAIRGENGAVVAARRDPAGRVHWTVTFDPGLDAGDPELQRVAREALAELRRSYGA